MNFSNTIRKLLRCSAALLIVLAAVLPLFSAAAQDRPSETVPMTGRRSFDLLGSSELFEAEITISVHRLPENGLCTVCHNPDPAIRRNLSKNLAKLVPDAGINTKVPVVFRHRDVTDFIGRNTESFLSVFMKCIKYVFNFFNQIIGFSF